MNTSDLILTNVLMPSKAFDGLWDSIVLDQSIKDRLLRAALLSLRLRASLPFEITALHGLIVLYGPPGTGKTTLARGLAQQLAPLTAKKQARFVEVNPHGLMSAEHGQSQRRVNDLLTEVIPSLASDGLPTVVLLDEVETMAVARSEASLAANPADVHRATDAVLTALDTNARSCPNLIFVATSNFTGAVDEAFLSRADVSIHVPSPNAAGVLAILKKVFGDLSGAFPALGGLANDPELHQAAQLLAGLDGRRIRKLILDAMLGRLDTVLDPGALTVEDVTVAAKRVVIAGKKKPHTGDSHGTH